jgi:hypothetical protein
VSQFFSPLKQAGAVVETVGAVTGQTSVKTGGKFVRNLLEPPQTKLESVIKKSSSFCNAVRL